MFDTLTDARAALDIARGQIARGLFVPPAERRAARLAEAARVEVESVTVREWSQRWLAELEAKPDRSQATVVSYRSVLKNHILDELGDIRLTDLTTDRVADHLAALGRQRWTRHRDSRVNGVAPNVVIGWGTSRFPPEAGIVGEAPRSSRCSAERSHASPWDIEVSDPAARCFAHIDEPCAFLWTTAPQRDSPQVRQIGAPVFGSARVYELDRGSAPLTLVAMNQDVPDENRNAWLAATDAVVATIALE